MTNGIEGLGVFKHTIVSTPLALSVHTVDTLETPTSTAIAVSGGVFINYIWIPYKIGSGLILGWIRVGLFLLHFP
jgi:hypothetical protein